MLQVDLSFHLSTSCQSRGDTWGCWCESHSEVGPGICRQKWGRYQNECFALTMSRDGGIGGSFLPGLELQKGLERGDLARLGWKAGWRFAFLLRSRQP